MADLYITEVTNLAKDGIGAVTPFLSEPSVATQKIAFTTAAQSAAFSALTRLVRLVPTADCHVAFGENPTATANDELLKAGQEYVRGVTAGHKISVYDGSS